MKMKDLGAMNSSSSSLPALTARRQEVAEQRSEHTSSFNEVIEISSDEERCLFLSALGQSLCSVNRWLCIRPILIKDQKKSGSVLDKSLSTKD